MPQDVSTLGDEFQRVVEDLRRRYIVGYTSTNGERDGKWREVEIRVKAGGRSPFAVLAVTALLRVEAGGKRFMLEKQMRLEELLGREVTIRWYEGVPIIQAVCRQLIGHDGEKDVFPNAMEILLAADGTVVFLPPPAGPP